jgi:hypothetical protein
MSITITPKMSLEEIKKLLERLPVGKRMDAKKHCGVINLNVDPLVYQKQARDEWR